MTFHCCHIYPKILGHSLDEDNKPLAFFVLIKLLLANLEFR